VARKAPKPSSTSAPSTTGAGDLGWDADERRIKDVESARSIYNRMLNDNVLRSATFARVRNQLEGGRPFDPEFLAEQGAQWQTNVNFGDSRAARDRTLLPYWKMVNDVPHRISTTIQTSTPHNEVYQQAFNQCFDEFLDDWGADYFIQFMNIAENFVNFGPGIAHWPDPDSARFKSVNVQRALWPKNARMSPDEWDVVAFTQDMGPSDLYQKIRTKKKQRDNAYAGWNVEAIKKTITTFKGGNYQLGSMDYTRWQDILVNNDIATSTPFEPIPIVWLFVKQFSGEIGCYVFCNQGGVNQFLFKSEKYSKDFRKLMGCIWYDTGTDSMIHSIKGFAVKNYYFSSLMNRTKSRIVDGATMALGMNFQRDDANIPDEAPPIENYGPVTIFPPGMSQMQLSPNLQVGMTVVEMLDNNAATNNSLYREQQQQIEKTDTATQAKILAAMQSETSAASASIYLSQVGENLFTPMFETLRRKGNTNPDAVEFVKRMRELKVPDEVIFSARVRVKTGANAGLANPAMRLQAYQEGMAMRSMPGVNSRWFLENWIATRFGANAVNKALLPEGELGDPYQKNQATIENIMFGQGQPLEVVPEDNHFLHLQVHLEPLKQIAGMAQAGQPLTPEQLTALTIGVEHSSGHMQYLSQDQTMKEQFMSIRPLFSQISSVTRGILMQQAKQQQQFAAQGGAQPAMTG
jgi:hypothetical protein